MANKTINTLFLLLFVSIFTNLYGQQVTTSEKIAFINSKELLEVVPGKVAATKSIQELNKKYKNELALMQNDYNNKYTDFLSNQNDLGESIKLRRMQELYELEQNITRFMKVAQEDVQSQEQQLIEPLKKKLYDAIEQVGVEQSFVCIYDKANPAIAFVTPNAIDANALVKQKLGKR